MRFNVEIESSDIEKIRLLIAEQSENPLVISRQFKNISDRPESISKYDFWNSLIMCLLTTQQRLGKNSAVVKFLNQNKMHFLKRQFS